MTPPNFILEAKYYFAFLFTGFKYVVDTIGKPETNSMEIQVYGDSKDNDIGSPVTINSLVLGQQYQVTSNVINFITPLPDGTMQAGTTNEELILVLLSRLSFLDVKFPCDENKEAIAHLRSALEVLLDRTAKRVAQQIVGQQVPHS